MNMKDVKNPKTTNVGRIDSVESTIAFNTATNGKWVDFLQKINPLGIVAESYAKTLAYRIEVKRLEAEELRIKEQAKLAHSVIDSTLKLKVKELEQRKIALIVLYQTVNNELERIHIERTKVLEMAQEAQKACLDKSASIEEKQLYKEMALEMTRELPNFGNQANASLQQLVQSLPRVSISQKLIEG